MADITITVNSRAVHAMLDRAPAQINGALRGGVEDATTYLLAITRRYPPQRSGSTYVRTLTLQRSWSRRVTGSGLTIQGIVGSSGAMAPYNRLVMDATQQMPVHRGRWSTVQDIAERSRPTVQGFFDARLAGVLR